MARSEYTSGTYQEQGVRSIEEFLRALYGGVQSKQGLQDLAYTGIDQLYGDLLRLGTAGTRSFQNSMQDQISGTGIEDLLNELKQASSPSDDFLGGMNRQRDISRSRLGLPEEYTVPEFALGMAVPVGPKMVNPRRAGKFIDSAKELADFVEELRGGRFRTTELGTPRWDIEKEFMRSPHVLPEGELPDRMDFLERRIEDALLDQVVEGLKAGELGEGVGSMTRQEVAKLLPRERNIVYKNQLPDRATEDLRTRAEMYIHGSTLPPSEAQSEMARATQQRLNRLRSHNLETISREELDDGLRSLRNRALSPEDTALEERIQDELTRRRGGRARWGSDPEIAAHERRLRARRGGEEQSSIERMLERNPDIQRTVDADLHYRQTEQNIRDYLPTDSNLELGDEEIDVLQDMYTQLRDRDIISGISPRERELLSAIGEELDRSGVPRGRGPRSMEDASRQWDLQESQRITDDARDEFIRIGRTDQTGEDSVRFLERILGSRLQPTERAALAKINYLMATGDFDELPRLESEARTLLDQIPPERRGAFLAVADELDLSEVVGELSGRQVDSAAQEALSAMSPRIRQTVESLGDVMRNPDSFQAVIDTLRMFGPGTPGRADLIQALQSQGFIVQDLDRFVAAQVPHDMIETFLSLRDLPPRLRGALTRRLRRVVSE